MMKKCDFNHQEQQKIFKGPDYTILARTMRYDKVSHSNQKEYSQYYDYCRYRTFELVAEQIKAENIQGGVAEAGVNEGDFAFMINLCFPDRQLYLYDTFDGFDERDIEVEMNNAYSCEEWLKRKPFSGTTASNKMQSVMQKMRFPESCIIRKGYFPESAAQEDKNTFAFVSIDMDLYAPIRAGLEFFYKRLSKGGYIFLHDYNHDNLTGAKVAVKEYEQMHGLLSKVPIADGSGTLIITK